MTKAARILRSSQGSNDKIGLDVQDETTEELAEDLGVDDRVDLDLGLHTGVALGTRGIDVDDDKRIDQHPEVQELLNDLRAGEYDYLIAYDDTRVARDRFLVTVEHACIIGDCELKFVEEADTDDRLSFWIPRFAETHTKIKEMRATIRALEHRQENDYYHGRPRYGTQYDEAGQYLVPGDDFEDALKVLALDAQDVPKTHIVEETGVSRKTVYDIIDRRDWYLDLAEEHGIELPEQNAVATDGGDSGDS